MKKIVTIVLLALTAIPSFFQENTLKFGVRAGFNLYNVFWDGKPLGIGTGYGGGLATVMWNAGFWKRNF
jgi:hypothetical protein